LHIRDALDAVASRHPGLVSRFGGHAMAAGLTLAQESYPAFAVAFDTEVSRVLSADDLNGVIYTDGELAGDELTLETARQLREAGPWGQGFPEPLFEGRFEIVTQRVVGERHLKLTLQPRAGSGPVEAIAFNTPALAAAHHSGHLVYRLDVNEFRGVESAQLVIEYIAGTE
jgi:single-stranded-DNA-specific exonuclease